MADIGELPDQVDSSDNLVDQAERALDAEVGDAIRQAQKVRLSLR